MEKDKDISVEVVINGKVEQVFELITQARFWPQWHVLTRAVTGVIERPFLPGDKFTEFIRTPNGTVEVAWVVIDYERFKKVSIQAAHGSVITYTFTQVPEGTLFKRVLDSGEQAEAKKEDTNATATTDTEQQSVANLKALVERIVKNEKKGPIYP